MELHLKVKVDPGAYFEDMIMLKLQLMTVLRYIEAHERNAGQIKIEDVNRVKELICFCNNVAQYYPHEMKEVGELIVQVLSEKVSLLPPKLRKELIFGVIKMKNTGILKKELVIGVLFDILMRVPKSIRILVKEAIVSHMMRDRSHDIHLQMLKLIRESLNRVNEKNSAEFRPNVQTESFVAFSILFDLYKKGVWVDEKSVSVAVDACFCKCLKTSGNAIMMLERNFDDLGSESDDEEDESAKQIVAESRKALHSKKTRARIRKRAKIGKKAKSLEKRDLFDEAEGNSSFKGAIELIHAPQRFAEDLFSMLKSSNRRLEDKIYGYSLISKLISLDSLLLPKFYSFMERYLNPHVRYSSKFLAIVSTACHNYMPHNSLESILRVIIDNFVTDKSRPEFITIGLNSVREICARAPGGLSTEQVSDLIMYRKYKDKGVVAAARSLISLYRSTDPEFLPKSERGKEGSMNSAAVSHSGGSEDENDDLGDSFDDFSEEPIGDGDIQDEDMLIEGTSDYSDEEDVFEKEEFLQDGDNDSDINIPFDVSAEDIEQGIREKTEKEKEKKIHTSSRKRKTGGLSNVEKNKKKSFQMVKRSKSRKKALKKREFKKRFSAARKRKKR